LPNSIAHLLQRLDLCLTGTAPDATRFGELGAPQVFTTGNLKLDVPAPPADPAALAALQDAIGDRPVVAAASTHAAEEGSLLEAHIRFHATFRGRRPLTAPRPPERGTDIAAAATAAGLSVALRSRGELPSRNIDIYVADTVGELGLLYRVAPAVFIGGSFVKDCGPNPIEAAQLASATLTSPPLWNLARN